MSARCHDHACSAHAATDSPTFRRALWIALAVNLAMFVVEAAGSWQAQSAALLADAIDFAGDAANYGLALWALGMAALWRSRVAWFKGWSMIAFGIAVTVKALWNLHASAVPEALSMGAIGLLALAANVGVALLLYAYRSGDANMRAVWLCTRNDAIGNLALLLAALGVFGTQTALPDVVVALLMAGLALHSGMQIAQQAKSELKRSPA